MKFENSNRVFILNKHGKPLMPCKPRKARLLLKSNKAKIIKQYPFTIQLLYMGQLVINKILVLVSILVRDISVLP